MTITTSREMKDRKINDRQFLLVHTRCTTLLADMLAKPELFTEAQLKMSLSVLRGLFFGSETVEDLGLNLKLKKLGIAKFVKSTLQSGFVYPKLIGPALAALGQCFIAYREEGLLRLNSSESIEIIKNMMPVIVKWMPKARNITNEGYMRGVAMVVTGVLSRMHGNITDVVATRVFDVFAALLKNQMLSTSIVVCILTKGFSDWVITDQQYSSDYEEDYSAYLDDLDEKKANGVEAADGGDDDVPTEWPCLMEAIATSGLCELLVEITHSHCDRSARERAKVITDWLGDASQCLSDHCAERIAYALQKFSPSSLSSSSSSSSSVASSPESTTSGVVVE